MFSEYERVQIRTYMGSGAIYKQLFPKLENAITAIQSLADGGSQKDSSTENIVRVNLTKLDTLETKIESLHCQLQIVEAGLDNVTLNATKALYVLKSEGRRYIGTIARILACAPVYDYFSSQTPSQDHFSNIYSVM
jgi:hypothetical protein